MIGHDVVNAALEGMTLLFETFSRKERKMPRLTIKTSNKNLIKVASFAGLRKDWCSYWIVPAIPESGTILVPAGFRFFINEAGYFFATNESGDTRFQLFEGDYLVLVSPSIKDRIVKPSKGDMMHWISEGIFTCNKPYFERQWQPAESDDKSIPSLIAKGTLIDTESKDYQNMAGLRNALAEHAPSKGDSHENENRNRSIDSLVFDSRESAEDHMKFKTFEHRVINERNPSWQDLALMTGILHQQGRAVIDTLNPSKDDLSLAIKLLMERSYLIYRKGETGFSDLAWVKSLLRAEGYHVMTQEERLHLRDMNYESGYAKGLAEGRRQVSDSNVFATRAYQVGFDAGRMVERLGILNGEETHDREERESASEGDPRVGREGESRAVRWSSGRGGPSQSIRRSESRSHSTTQWADSEQPQYSEPGESTGDSIHQANGEATPQCNEDEKGDA